MYCCTGVLHNLIMTEQCVDGTDQDVEMQDADPTTVLLYLPERTALGKEVWQRTPDSDMYMILRKPPWRSKPKRCAKMVTNGCTITAKEGDKYNGNIIETEKDGRWLEITMSREKLASQTGSEKQQEESSAKRARVFERDC